MDKKAIEHLATLAYGHTCKQCPHVIGDIYERDCSAPDCYTPTDFNPFENIEQAFMLLDKFDMYVSVTRNGIDFWTCSICDIKNQHGVDECESGKTPAEAICNAVLKATGYEDSQP